MTKDFYKKKKPWSHYKDRILIRYLWPYLSKVRTLGIPILVVDCCAGPGRFGDGEDGSPLIIASRLAGFSGRYRSARIDGVFIETDDELFAQLERNLKPFDEVAQCINSRYQEHLRQFEGTAENAAVFLYIDPFTARELPFSELTNVFGMVQRGSCIEFLMNFGAAGVVRWGRSILAGAGLVDRPADGEEFDALTDSPDVAYGQLDDVLGGDWWIPLLRKGGSLRDMQLEVCEEYKSKLRTFMPLVGGVPIRARYEHVPKYHMIFGTRHRDGLCLMNDSMARTNQDALDMQFDEGFLFDTAPVDSRPSVNDVLSPLEEIVIEHPNLLRSEVFSTFLAADECAAFALYSESILKKAFKELERQQRIHRRPPKAKVDEARFLPGAME